MTPDALRAFCLALVARCHVRLYPDLPDRLHGIGVWSHDDDEVRHAEGVLRDAGFSWRWVDGVGQVWVITGGAK